MFKGYKSHISEKNKDNKTVSSLGLITKCKKCNKLNPVLQSPALNNVQNCVFCGNPFYIIKYDVS